MDVRNVGILPQHYTLSQPRLEAFSYPLNMALKMSSWTLRAYIFVILVVISTLLYSTESLFESLPYDFSE